MRALTVLFAVVALAVVGAGCGGGDDEEASGDTATVVTATAPETETDETTTEELDTSGLEGLASEDCLQLVNAGLALSQAFGAASSGGGDLDEAAEIFDQLVDRAPSEIRADLATLARFFSEYAQVLQDIDLQEGELPSAADLQRIQGALASVDQPELQAASERLSAWATANCPGG